MQDWSEGKRDLGAAGLGLLLVLHLCGFQIVIEKTFWLSVILSGIRATKEARMESKDPENSGNHHAVARHSYEKISGYVLAGLATKNLQFLCR